MIWFGEHAVLASQKFEKGSAVVDVSRVAQDSKGCFYLVGELIRNAWGKVPAQPDEVHVSCTREQAGAVAEALGQEADDHGC